MKNLLLALISLACFHFCKADDGAFYSMGGTIFPLEKTDIELRKQEINFIYSSDSGGYMHVQVSFHFFNPSDEKDILVGFVSPGYNGAELDSSAPPEIWNFSVLANNALLPFEIHHIDSVRTPKLYSSIGKNYNDYFVYLFKVHFSKGWNNVYHVYDFKGDISNTYKNSFSYYFKTGKTWANKKIDEIYISISGLKNYFAVIPHKYSDSDSSIYNWKMNGIAKDEIFESKIYDYTKPTVVDFIYVRDATISTSIKNFTPDLDFCIIILDYSSLGGYYYDSPKAKDERINKLSELMPRPSYHYSSSDLLDLKREISAYSNDDLQFFINSIYASEGYPFKNEELKTFYEKTIWYIPDYSTKDFKMKLDKNVRDLLDMLLEEQKKRKP
jgi:hypothetical protein